MSREFEVRREIDLPGTPEQVFAAVTTDTEAWLFPSGGILEARVGAVTGDGSKILAWDPPNHFHVRAETADGWFNAVEFLISAREGGSAVLRYVHSGMLSDGWEDQYDGIDAHTDFYLHTLAEYLQHFVGRPIAYIGGDGSTGLMGPESSSRPGSFAVVRSALGLDSVSVGDTVRVNAGTLADDEATVNYATDNFIGLRTSDALYCFFGRDAFGGPVAVAGHVFADDSDAAAIEKTWQGWLDAVYG